MLYNIDIYEKDDVPHLGIEGEWGSDAEALNWAYYYMGVWRSPKAKLWRRWVAEDSAPHEPEDFITEISSGGYEKNFG